MTDPTLDGDLLSALGVALTEARTSAMVLVARDGTVLFANPGAAAALGREGSALQGEDLHDLVVPEDRRTLARLLAPTGSSAELLRFADTEGGNGRALVVSGTGLGPAHGDAVLLLGRDAGAEGDGEERKRAAERYEIVGRLASGVAHELNNALSTVTTYADLLLADAEPGSEASQDLADIKAAALDAASVIRKLDLFSGGERPSEPGEVHVPEVVRGARKLLSRFLTRNVVLTMELDDEATAVRATPMDVEEILFALAANAREALDGTGEVTFSVRKGGSGSAPTTVLEVSDSGGGTRPSTGTGRAVVERIAGELGGSFDLLAGPSGETVARVELPAVADLRQPL